MSAVKERLKDDLKVAMKAKDVFKRETIRFLMSALKQVEVDERRDLSNEDVYKIIQKSIKQREDAATQYKAAEREDLYEKEVKEAAILKEYLPKQLGEEELKAIITDIIAQSGASGMKDMGNVIKLTVAKVGAGADGKTISSMVKGILN